jgi:holin-like protein
MIRALTLILLCQLAGEAVTRGLSLPIPGPVLGMAILWGLMMLWAPIAEAVRPVGEGILRHLSLLFVPAGVGVVGHIDQLGTQTFALGLAILVSTVLAIAAGAWAFVLVAKLTGSTDA